MAVSINRDMIQLGRLSRGYTQEDLAKVTGLSQSVISKYESGELGVGLQELAKIADSLGYPFRFFIVSYKNVFQGGSGIYHRHRRSKISAKELEQVHARLNILRVQVQRILHYNRMTPELTLPHYRVEDFGYDARAIAKQVREDWALPNGPVEDMVEALEAAGIIIIPATFETGDISAVSLLHPDSGAPPIIYLNAEMPTDHQRFSLAHELGHLVMHRYQHDNVESEANAFASEFLMPEGDIGSSLFSVKLPMLFRLKPYWRVSVSALIERAHQLKKITDNQRSELHRQMRAQNLHKNEPYPLSNEEPTILAELLRVCADDHGFSLQDMSEIMLMNPDELKWMFDGMEMFRDEPQPDVSPHSYAQCLATMPEKYVELNRRLIDMPELPEFYKK